MRSAADKVARRLCKWEDSIRGWPWPLRAIPLRLVRFALDLALIVYYLAPN